MSYNYQSFFSRGIIECTNRAKESVGDLIGNLERAFDGRLREEGRSALPEDTVVTVS
jgi:hypothetical protein